MARERLHGSLSTVEYFTFGFGTMIGVGWLVLMDDWLTRGRERRRGRDRPPQLGREDLGDAGIPQRVAEPFGAAEALWRERGIGRLVGALGVAHDVDRLLRPRRGRDREQDDTGEDDHERWFHDATIQSPP